MLAPGLLHLDADQFLLSPNASIIFTVTVELDAGGTVEGSLLSLILPAALNVTNAGGGSIQANRVQWTLPSVTQGTPFVGQVRAALSQAAVGTVYKISTQLEQTGFAPKIEDLLIGVVDGEQEFAVLLDPETSAQGVVVTIVPYRPSPAQTPEPSPTNQSTVATDVSPTVEQTPGETATDISTSESTPIETPSPATTQPVQASDKTDDVPVASQATGQVYLPLISDNIANNADAAAVTPSLQPTIATAQSTTTLLPSPAASGTATAVATTTVVATPTLQPSPTTTASVTPLFREDGITAFSAWQIDAVRNGVAVHQLSKPATILFSVAHLAAAGVDPRTLHVWTRTSDAAGLYKVPAIYDAKKQLILVRTSHFSPWTLGSGMTSSGVHVPSLRGFSNDLFTGSSIINIPIESPKGLGGMNPNLSLSYSSGSADEVENNNRNNYNTQANYAGGLGWSLGGVSYIYRDFGATTDRFDDRFFLVLNGTTVQLSEVSGAWVTNPEIFVKVNHATHPQASHLRYYNTATWTITTGDGTTYLFGADTMPDAQGEANVGKPIGAWASATALMLAAQDLGDGTKTRSTGARWYLRKVTDTLGNYMTYSYNTETDGIPWACIEGNLLVDENRSYQKVTYLSSVEWSAHDNANNSFDVTPKMQITLGYSLRSDRYPGVYNGFDCVHEMYSDNLLTQIDVKVKDTSDLWQLYRRYMIDYGGGNSRHSLAVGVRMYGEGGTISTANLMQTNLFTYTGSTSSARISEATTAFNGKSLFVYGDTGVACYTSSTTTNCNTDYSNYRRRPLTSIQNFDGLGNSYFTNFAYAGAKSFTPLNLQNNPLDYEFLGFNLATVTNTLSSGVKERFEEHWFHQCTVSGSGCTTTSLRGKEYQTYVYGFVSGVAKRQSRSNVTWSAAQTYPGSWWPHQNEVIAYVADPNGLNEAGKRTTYDYETARQNGGQYGNLTKVVEYASDNITPKRTTTTDYFPNTTKWIINLPARVRVFQGTDALANCKSEKRIHYLRSGDGNYTNLPPGPQVQELYQAINFCSDTTSIDIRSTDWDVVQFDYDIYGNQTIQDRIGAAANDSEDRYLDTYYDSYYHLFPLRQRQNPTDYSETATYYGVGNQVWEWSFPNGVRTATPVTINAPPPPVLSDWRAHWGAMAEYCPINDICTRQAYDNFGRTTFTWESVIRNTAWSANTAQTTDEKSANVRFTYRDPLHDAGYKTTMVSEWRSPRCDGNFVRKHYNGLGQLVTQQTPNQNWAFLYDDCSRLQNLSEIDTFYAYNSLGQQVRASVPVLTSTSLITRVNGVIWTTIWNSIDDTLTEYDALGRVLKTTSPNGEQTLGFYRGRESAIIGLGRAGDPSKVLKWNEVDELGNLRYIKTGSWNGSVPVLDTPDSTVNLTHDVLGNLTNVYNSYSGATTTITYDKAGRKTQMIDADMGTWNYRYDKQGKLVWQQDGRLSEICLSYDSLDRLTYKDYRSSIQGDALGVCTTPTYNAAYIYDELHGVVIDGQVNRSRGQLTSSGAAGVADYFIYTDRGLLRKTERDIASASQLYSTTYGYDAYNRPSTITYPDGEVVTLNYNSMGLPNRLESSQIGTIVDGTTSGGGISNGVDYDEAGRVKSLRFPLGGNLVRRLTYAPWGQQNSNGGMLTVIEVGTGISGNFGDRMALNYQYDSFSNIKQLQEYFADIGSVSIHNFTYDGNNMLTNGFGGTSNSYDKAGRLINKAGSVMGYDLAQPTNAPQTKDTSQLPYTYHANGTMATRPVPGGVDQFLWLYEMRVHSVTGPSGTETFQYDADGQRAVKSSNLAGDGVDTTSFYVNQFYEVTQGGNFIESANASGVPPIVADRVSLISPEILIIPNESADVLPVENTGAPNNRLFLPLVNRVLPEGQSEEYRNLQTGAPCTNLHEADCSRFLISFSSEMDPIDRPIFDPVQLEQLNKVTVQPENELSVEPTSAAVAPPLYPEQIYVDQVDAAAVGTGILNPSFEQDGGWTEYRQWNGTSYLRTTWGTAAPAPAAGAKGEAISNQAYGVLESTVINGIVGGATYDFFAQTRGQIDADDSSGGGLILRVLFFDNSNYLESKDVLGVTSMGTGWVRRGGTITASPTATRAILQFHVFMISGWVAFDAVEFYRSGNSTNLAPNPSFESSGSWSEVRPVQYPNTAFFRSTFGTSSPQHLSYAYSISNHAYGKLLSDFIPVTVAAQYDLFAYVRGKFDPDVTQGSAQISAAFYDSNQVRLSTTSYVATITGNEISASWAYTGGRFTVPSGASFIRIQLHNFMTSGWAAFDDVQLTRVGVGAVTVPNANFEGSSNWTFESTFPGTTYWRGDWGIGGSRPGGAFSGILTNHTYAILGSSHMAALGGGQFSIRARLRGQLDADESYGNGILRVVFYNSLGNSIVYTDVGTFGQINNTVYTQISGTVTAPAGATHLLVQVHNFMTGGWLAVDDVQAVRTTYLPQIVTKYYYFGGMRVAMRENGKLYYLHGDHLGSVVLSTDNSGRILSSRGYSIYGEFRSGGTQPTEFGFTGQKHDANGLIYMNARYFDPLIGQFISADSIVPDPTDKFSYNRYLYARGNPLKFIDPSGHDACGPGANPYCNEYMNVLKSDACKNNRCNMSYREYIVAMQHYTQYALNPDQYYIDVLIEIGAIEGDSAAAAERTLYAQMYSSYVLNLDIDIALEREANGTGSVSLAGIGGGAYWMLKPSNPKRAHHMPAKSVSGISESKGPAILMDAEDHLMTSSYGYTSEAQAYRAWLKNQVDNGRTRDALAAEIRDVRRVASQSKGTISYYNTVIREMIAYAKKIGYLDKK